MKKELCKTIFNISPDVFIYLENIISVFIKPIRTGFCEKITSYKLIVQVYGNPNPYIQINENFEILESIRKNILKELYNYHGITKNKE